MPQEKLEEAAKKKLKLLIVAAEFFPFFCSCMGGEEKLLSTTQRKHTQKNSIKLRTFNNQSKREGVRVKLRIIFYIFLPFYVQGIFSNPRFLFIVSW